MATVRAVESGVLLHPAGIPVAVAKGQGFQHDDDLVVAHPTWFRTDADADGLVEMATRNPGEKRRR